MKKITLLTLTLLLCLSLSAQTYAPHSLKAETNFSTVNLSWKAPNVKNALQWHNDYAYNGNDGDKTDPYGTLKFWMGARFEASDLTNVVGEQIDSIGYYQYREMVSLTLFIYENEKEVYSQALDVTNYEKDVWRKYALTTPYKIPANTDVKFALKLEYGENFSFGAIKDDGDPCTYYGKGDVYSLDGINWYNSGDGNYLLTAYVKNPGEGSADPDGYNVYCDGTKMNSEPLTEATYSAQGIANGEHTFYVTAIYGQDEVISKEIKVTVKNLASSFPPVNLMTPAIDGFSTTFSWIAPMIAPAELTWCNKEKSTAIGATSKTTPVVWIKNDFTPTDLISYVGGEISSISAHFSSTVTGVTLFVMKNDVIVYSEELSNIKVKSISADAWKTLNLATPVKIEEGASYSYGMYITHTAGLKPITISTNESVGTKGSTFSTSTQSSSGFDQSKPYWKTLAQGDIPGNWMMTATVTGATASNSVSGYEIYRDGEKIASNITETTYTDEVSAPGTYTYGFVAKSNNDLTSEMVTTTVTYSLPLKYNAPNIQNASLEGNKVNLAWNMDIEMKHYGTPTYIAGFDEEMSLMYGTRFTAAELAPYAGYQLTKLQIVLAEKVGDFSVGVYTSKGVVLSEVNLKEADIEPYYYYTIDLTTPVEITETSDFYIAYKVTAPAGSSPIILDGGPLVTNGAMVSLTEGATWMKLSTINSTYNDYNIVIGANLTPVDNSTATSTVLTKSSSIERNTLTRRVVGVNDVELGIGANSAITTKATVLSGIAPKATSFEIYRNKELIATATETNFTDYLSSCGGYIYNVRAIFENGWKSELSEDATIHYEIAQKPEAPFDLTGAYAENSLALSWKSPEEATVFSYATGDEENDVPYKITGMNEAYFAIKMPVETVNQYAGMELSHVKFKIASTSITSMSVVVMYGTNIAYTQPVNVNDLQVGWNNIRLDKPMVVKENVEMGIGYLCSYPSGTSVVVADAGPVSKAGYSDLLSASAYSWKSMNDNFGISCNWRIQGILKKADNALLLDATETTATDETTTYNVYCNGEIVAEGLTTTQYSVANPAYGKYVVTAVTDGVESAESNVLSFYPSAIEDTMIDDNAPVEYYNLQGIKVNADELGSGVYIKKQGNKVSKITH